ncbi:MAG: S-layer homology domain-containing protein [Firmicutes bacterium]|nr:S-layer homology domain-containing protein [Bacillota bacterium]
MKKTILPLFFTLLMLLTLFPANVLAEEFTDEFSGDISSDEEALIIEEELAEIEANLSEDEYILTDEEFEEIVVLEGTEEGIVYALAAKTAQAEPKKVWDFFVAKLGNEYGAAGVMGNLKAESGFLATNVQNSFESKLGYNDNTYTDAVDNGSYSNFVHDSAGYGLAQWTYWSRKQGLLNYAKSINASIGNIDMQLEYLWKELQGYSGLINTLKNSTSVAQAASAFMIQFERPADQSAAAQAKRASFGQTYYDMYAGKTTTTTTYVAAPATNSSDTSVKFPKLATYRQGMFRDVPSNEWFTKYVASAYEMSLMKGKLENLYEPYEQVNVAQAITMAARVHSIYTTGKENFKQTGNNWFRVYLDYAYQNGIIDYAMYWGNVERTATRGEFALIFSKAIPNAGLKAINNKSMGSIKDVPSSNKYASAIYKLYNAGVICGKDDGRFHPNDKVTRAEAATILTRMADSSQRIKQ